MKREPKTPRTGPQWTRWNWWSPFVFYAQYGRYRRLPKGKRAKSGQWWRRTPCPVAIGEAVDRRIEAMRVRAMAVWALKQIAESYVETSEGIVIDDPNKRTNA